ncbi:hypothetical protein QAD02_006513 [Eretmocerus hayati]|uniref:Uncharacterized protein n=1 Tax=Eretmocerus hayati TaxID=131215 RepID=A0ACC2N1G4_9HYME|nr:hypothetical protein QAD02_006513 [Eretmocerus hayati]
MLTIILRGFPITCLILIARAQLNLNNVVDGYTELFHRIERYSNKDTQNLTNLTETVDLSDGRGQLEFILTNGNLSGLSNLTRGGNFAAILIPRIFVRGVINIPKLVAHYDYSATISNNTDYGFLDLEMIDVTANLRSGFNIFTSSIQNADVRIFRIRERSSRLTSKSLNEIVDLDSQKIDHLLFTTGMLRAIEEGIARYIEETSTEVNRRFFPMLVQQLTQRTS